jgi:hypothetical protein
MDESTHTSTVKIYDAQRDHHDGSASCWQDIWVGLTHVHG